MICRDELSLELGLIIPYMSLSFTLYFVLYKPLFYGEINPYIILKKIENNVKLNINLPDHCRSVCKATDKLLNYLVNFEPFYIKKFDASVT